MAKQQNHSDPADVVIFFARARGGSAVVAETVRALADAVDRATRPGLPTRVVKSLAADPKRDDKTLFDPVDEPAQRDVVENAEATNDALPGTRQRRGQGPKKDRNAGIELVGDIDFVPKSKPSLKSFFADKAPSSDMDQILVLSYYLKHTLELAKFGVGHILSGFKHVVKPVPVDLKQTIRNMRTGKAWLRFTDIEDIRLTTEGENHVEHELGKSDGDAGVD